MKRIESLKPGDSITVNGHVFNVYNNVAPNLYLTGIEGAQTMTYGEIRRVGALYNPPKLGKTQARNEVVA